MMKLALQFCITIFTLTAMHSNVLADTYRWLDDGGVVNYSEQKPRGIPAERITEVTDASAKGRQAVAARSSTANPSSQSDPAADNPADGNLDKGQQDMLRSLQQAEADRQQQVAKIRNDNCQRSRRVLANLSAKDRIRVRGDDGNERALPEEERQQRISEAQQGIVTNCDA